MRKHVWKLLNAQRDLLSPQAIEGLNTALADMDKAVGSGADKATLTAQMTSLEQAANKWLRPYPHPAWRENVEVLLVALAVAMAIRTFFVQPFKIPTGSMQPTLWGVTSDPDYSRTGPPPPGTPPSDFKVPTGFARLWDIFHGVSYVRVTAKTDGELEAVEPPVRFLIFNIYQRLKIGGVTHSIWFPPDYGGSTLEARAGLELKRRYRKGDDVVKLRMICGDHLFVDRVSYNFRRPHRGDIIVFETKGISHRDVPTDQFYIKRLVALGNEQVRVGRDQHLIIDGNRLDATTPGFENVYSFKKDAGPNQYFGHVPAGKFIDPTAEPFQVRTNHFMVMGDNTRNSLDSRYFGDFSRDYVIGKSWFVYWPISSRFGLGYR